MRQIIYNGEARLSDLVARAYEIEPADTEAVASAAEEALLEANPRLADLGKVVVGTPISVPEVPGTKSTAEAQSVLADLHNLLASVRSLDGLGTILERAAKEKQAAGQRTKSLAKELRGVVSEDAAKARLAEIEQEAGERVSAAEALARSSTNRRLVVQIEEDIASIGRALAMADARSARVEGREATGQAPVDAGPESARKTAKQPLGSRPARGAQNKRVPGGKRRPR